MIVDNIKNITFYNSLSETFKKAFEVALTLDGNTPCGRVDICDGLFVNVMEYSGKDLHDAVGETHDEYIDIQYIIKGSEKIGYSQRNRAIMSKEYNKEKDIAFWNGNFEFVTLNEKDFLVAFPQDVHAPGVKVTDEKIKKAVFKLRVDKA